LDLAQHAQPWANWATWFRANGGDVPTAPTESFVSYHYLLEGAARGEGLAIGWHGMVDSYLEAKRLVKIRDNWWKSPVGLYAILTEAGHGNRNARSCLKGLAAAGERMTGTGQTAPQRQPTRAPGSSFRQA